MQVDLIDSMGSDLTVVNAARVSFNKESDCFDNKDEKLVNYLANHNHWSPFSHCYATFRIQAPIFVARQLAKHQVGFSWNEVSRRYVSDTPRFFTPDEWRKKAADKKQGSSSEAVLEPLYARQFSHTTTDEAVLKHYEASLKLYEDLLDNGTCEEQARMVLPQGAYTEWFWSGSLYAWSRFYNLRSKPDTQEETRQIAFEIGKELENLFPFSWKALTGNA